MAGMIQWKTAALIRRVAAVVAVPLAAVSAEAEGVIVSREPYVCSSADRTAWLDNFEGPVRDRFSSLIDDAAFDRLCVGGGVVVERITYLSDGVEVRGYAARPSEPGPDGVPVIIYNHGGVLEWGNIYFFDLLEFARLAARGYVVLASHFRGEGGSEGQADMGRGDVADALNLLDVADAIDGADVERVGMWGFSRGGRLTYQALAASDRIDAAVVIGGPTDALSFFRHDEFDEHVYPRAIPDYGSDPQAALERNSPLRWVERLAPAPILVLHGGEDDRVEVSDSLQMAQRLQDLGRPYQLTIYADGSHSLFELWHSVRRDMDLWFDRHLTVSDAPPIEDGTASD